MSEPVHAPDSIDDLPSVVPIFPLPGALLLPRGQLPLNIFETRYLQMTRDVLGSHRVIGMIQPVDPDAPSAAPEVYGIGCTGRITSFEETDDNRILIALNGLCRFDIESELEPEGLLYRRVRASYERFSGDLEKPAPITVDRSRLIPALRAYFERCGLSADWDAIDRAGDGALITCLAMACPFKPSEKQALLECEEDAQRMAMIQALLEMAIHEREQPEGRFQ